MRNVLGILTSFCVLVSQTYSSDVLGCGGFIKSHVQIDFTKIVVKLYTKEGILKEKSNCAPNNGYYFIPVYDKGEYTVQIESPTGWSFVPTKVNLKIDGISDHCSQGKDIDFVFKGFGITGKVESFGVNSGGPKGVAVVLESDKNEKWKATTDKGGEFLFTPIYPGKYTISISHPKWSIIKEKVTVEVREGNAELLPNSLVVGGYDVNGLIKSEDIPVRGVTVVLLESEDNKNIAKVSKCKTEQLKNFNANLKPLCHIESDDEGAFTFPNVSPGKYVLIPYHQRQNIHFTPERINFSVEHDSVILEKPFQIIGFSATGKILMAENGKPVIGAKIYLNDEIRGESAIDGSFTLDKVKADFYRVKVVADNLTFEEQIININPNNLNLPVIIPSAYKVSGTVLSENSQTVLIHSLHNSKTFTVQTEKNSGKFSTFLTLGKYQMQVKSSSTDGNANIQFFPLTHTIEVTNSPISGITFSQLKSVVSGKVRCIRKKDCEEVSVILKPRLLNNAETNSDGIAIKLKDSEYNFHDVRPGNYEVTVLGKQFCWKSANYLLTVSSIEEVVPDFEQIGYQVYIISSHDTPVYYKNIEGNETKTFVQASKGRTSVCVLKAGKFSLVVNDDCHKYNEDFFLFDVDGGHIKEIYLNAIKHKVLFGVEANKNLGGVDVTINIGREKILEKPYAYENSQYIFKFFLSPSETAILLPQSESLFFTPPILSVNGNSDCRNLGSVFKAVKGKVFKGRIRPPLPGVLITIETDNNNSNSESLIDETNETGEYKFPPLDDSKKYEITASKRSYVFTGPDEVGDFIAHKLAEIIVQVLDASTGRPLQGTLLSLSGGDSYRSNLQTGEDGKITFTSLTPSDYFIRPMMKEYIFEPNSEIVTVKEGSTKKIQLKGKRVAFSVFGHVSSLNTEPEEGLTVVAIGLNNCSSLSEEATSDMNGNFRVRGLQSFCSYSVQIKQTSEQMKNHLEQAIPQQLNVTVKNEDLLDVKFVVLRPVLNTNVLLKLHTINPEGYKSLRVKLLRETTPPTVVQIVKVDGTNAITNFERNGNVGILLQTSVPRDYKTYSVQIENVFNTIVSKSLTALPSLQFVSSSSFFYGQIEFELKRANTEQQIKQTSLWTLFIIFAVVFLSYNINSVAHFVKLGPIKQHLSQFFFNIVNTNQNNKSDNSLINESDVEQIVQSIITPKKKVKPRKI